MNDFRYALRGLLRTPAYSLAVLTVLAVGMALTTVTIAVVDGVLFKPLPFARPSELFVVQARAATQPEKPALPVSFRHIDALRQALPTLVFSGVSASTDAFVPAPGEEHWSAAIDERFFEVTGQSPLLGGFRAEDFAWSWDVIESGGTWQPQMISHRLWRRLYGADPAVIGRTFVTRENSRGPVGHRIVGVLRPDFVFPIDGGTDFASLAKRRRAPVSRARPHFGGRFDRRDRRATHDRDPRRAVRFTAWQPSSRCAGSRPTGRGRRPPWW
jgi:hypothetical protein